MYYFNAQLAKHKEVNAIKRTMEINEAYDKMAHIGKDTLQKTMQMYGVKLHGQLLPCDACMQEKARAKNLRKSTENPAT